MDASHLFEEVNYFHRELYGMSPSAEIVSKYSNGLKALGIDSDNVTSIVIERRLDVSACELALRGGGSAYVKKLWLLAYICETDPRYFNTYCSEEDLSWVSFLWGAFCQIFGLFFYRIYGIWLVRRYQLV